MQGTINWTCSSSTVNGINASTSTTKDVSL